MASQPESTTLPATTDYDRATAVTARDGRWAIDLDGSWSVGGFMNGGYLLAAMCGAAVRATGTPDTLAVTATFLSPPAAGPAQISVDVAKKGRQTTVTEMVLHQGGREHVRATAVLGDLDSFEGPSIDVAPPSIPPLEQCVSLTESPGPGGIGPPEIFRHFDVRLARNLGWLNGETPGTGADSDARIEGWTRFADGRDPDVTSLTLFADAFPPAVLDRFPAGWVPTLQYSVYVRARPRPGWLQGTFRTRSMVGGLLEEDGELYDSTGRLVALSRQLALLRPPS